MLCKQKPYFAFYLGAGDNRKADQAATQGLVLAVIHGVVMTVCCIAMMPAFLGMFTSSETVIELGVRYSVVAFAFTLIIIVGVTFEKIFQAVGNMKTTTFIYLRYRITLSFNQINLKTCAFRFISLLTNAKNFTSSYDDSFSVFFSVCG